MARRVKRSSRRQPGAVDALDRARIGRPRIHNPEIERVLLDAVRAGNHLNVACALAGVGQQTVYDWLHKANDTEEAIAKGEEVTDHALSLVRFRDRLTLARAEAEENATRIVHKVMAGGSLISEEPALNGDGLPVYDEEGNLAYKRTWTQPDGRLALEYLARTAPSRWGRQPAQGFEPEEVAGAAASAAGATGVPDQVVSALAERLRRAQQEAAERRAIDAPAVVDEDPGRVYEGEIVDEDDVPDPDEEDPVTVEEIE